MFSVNKSASSLSALSSALVSSLSVLALAVSCSNSSALLTSSAKIIKIDSFCKLKSACKLSEISSKFVKIFSSFSGKLLSFFLIKKLYVVQNAFPGYY